MKIAIDFREAYNGRGIGRYVKEIVLELAKIDSYNTYYLFITSKDVPLNLPKNFIFLKLPYLSFLDRIYFVVFEQIILPFLTMRYNPEILWCPGNTFPLIKNRRTRLFVTIHDLIFFEKTNKPKKWYQKIGKWYRRFMVIYGNRNIDTLFTVSEYSKAKLKATFSNFNPIITYNKINNFEFKINIDDSVLQTYNLLPEQYFYTVSGDTYSKNLITLLDIYRDYNIGEKLVITGIKNFKSSWAYKYVINNKLEHKIIFTHYLSDKELSCLYSNCKLFVFLSLSEGFGIPILEAMIYKRPILASNRSSIPEIVGKGGVLCDPLSKERIVEILSNMSSINWNKYIEKQNQQIKKFSDWGETAKIVLEYFLKAKR